jgi:rhomboid protease GluP
MTHTARRLWLTVVMLGATAAVSIVGLLDHMVLHDLERRGGELAAGEPWRLVTSLLVHDSWLALLANLVLLALVGIAVERRHGRLEWIVLYLTAGIVGELVGLDWQPHGAGNSVAILGLAGALVVDALRRRDPALLALGYATVVLVTLMADDIGGLAGGVIVVLVYIAASASFAATRQGTRVPRWGPPALGALALVVAAVLVAIGNIHGPALLAGVVVALVWDAVGATARVGARTGPSPRPR